ncbi:MAG: T9SS type A sorting domain-containing protein [Flavobacteriales bacterium]
MKRLIVILIVLTSSRMSAQYVQDVMHIHNAVGGVVSAIASKGDRFVMAFGTGDFVQFGDNELYTDLADKALIVLKSENLSTIWTSGLEFEEYDISYINDASFDNDGNIYLCGSSRSASYSIGELQHTASGFVLKLDPEGNPLWLHGIEHFTPESIAASIDNGAVVVGHFIDTLSFAGDTYFNPDPNGNWFPPIDACILKISAEETEEWAHAYSTIYDEEFIDVDIDQNGNIAVLGNSHSDTLYFNNEIVIDRTFLFNYSPDGVEQWFRGNSSLVSFDNVNSGFSLAIEVSEEGDIHWLHSFSISADTLFTPVGNILKQDCELLDTHAIKAAYKFSNDGLLIDVFGFSCVDMSQKWGMLPIGNQLLLSGEFRSTVNITDDITLYSTSYADNGFIMLLDQNMEPIWHIQTTEQNEDAKVHLTTSIALNNSVIVAGAFETEFAYENYAFTPDQGFDNILILLDTTNSIGEMDMPYISVFPNPVSYNLSIQNLPATTTQIKILDTTGRLLMTEYNKQQIDVAHLPSGIYLIEVSTDESRAVLKFVKE